MSIKLVFAFGLCLQIWSSAFGQPLPGNIAGGGSGINLSDHMLMLDSKKNMTVEPEEPVDGSPYLNEAFITGDVYSNKGKFASVPMRYNMYLDNIEFKEKDVTYVLAPAPGVQLVELGDYHLVVENIK